MIIVFGTESITSPDSSRGVIIVHLIIMPAVLYCEFKVIL